MGSDLAKAGKFDSHSLADQLKNKIRIDLAHLMPPEVWQQLLEREIETFFNEYTTDDGYNRHKTHQPQIRQIVWEVMRETTKEKVREMLSSKEWDGFWDGQKQKAGVKISELIRENADEILSSMLANSIQNVVQNMHSNL